MVLTAPTDFPEVHNDNDLRVILRCITGSRAYGTHTEASDTDIRGIFMVPEHAYLSLAPPPEQLANDSSDIVYYSIRRFLELASAANPNFIELLFMPEDCILRVTPIAEELISSRDMFISQRVFESHVAYAIAQIKRSRGQNKWVHNPKPKQAPSREAYCWFIPRETAQFNWPKPPFRPVPIRECGVHLSECHAASVEHFPGVYRLYYIGHEAQGVFRSGKIVCQSIPLEMEKDACIGLLMFNEAAYEQDIKDHRHYWKWREVRNQQRWQTQESGEMDYDAKNLMHTFRLILSAENIFETGKPLVRFHGNELQLLLDIRAGRFTYDELIIMAEDRLDNLQRARERSKLPAAPEPGKVNHLLRSLTDHWEKSRRA